MGIFRVAIAWTILASLGITAPASAREKKKALLQRDRSLERALRFESGADRIVTPGRVIRALFKKDRSAELDYPEYPNAEFYPIVDANEEQVRVVGAISYKF